MKRTRKVARTRFGRTLGKCVLVFCLDPFNFVTFQNMTASQSLTSGGQRPAQFSCVHAGLSLASIHKNPLFFCLLLLFLNILLASQSFDLGGSKKMKGGVEKKGGGSKQIVGGGSRK